MTFGDINNNDLLIKKTSESIAGGNVSHAYVFEAGYDTDKKTLADCFIKALLCGDRRGTGCDTCITCRKIDHGNHEDVIYIEKDETHVKDEAIEELQEKLKKKPYAGERSIAIIMDADTMTDRAQNRLLKTLEEPFPGTVIILLSENALNLKSTVTSRCAILRWNPFSDCARSGITAEAELIVRALLENEPFYLRKSKIMKLAANRDDAYKLLDAMEIIYGGYIRRHSFNRAAAASAIGHIEEARQELKRGINTGYTLKSMILKMEGEGW